jgi:hypothetical protein
MRRTSVRSYLLYALLVVFAMPVAAQSPSLSQEEIVTRLLEGNARRAEALRSYQGIRVYEVDYQGFPTGHKHARMTVLASCRAPYQRTFSIISESGSSLLLNHVLHKLIATEQESSSEQAHAESALSRANYRFEYLGQDMVDHRSCYKLRVIPLRSNKLLYDGTIWVDAQDLAVVRIAAHPAKPPSLWINQTEIEHEYGKIGDFWLPFRNKSTTRVRFGGRAVLTIDYQDYKLGEVRALASVPADGKPRK